MYKNQNLNEVLTHIPQNATEIQKQIIQAKVQAVRSSTVKDINESDVKWFTLMEDGTRGYGMTLGFPTILIPAVIQPRDGEVLHLNASEVSWIGSINLIVVPLGCAMSGVVTSPLGRRRAMQAVNLPFFIAWLIFHFSSTTGHLYGALFLTGLAGGLLEAPVLTYVAEITQPYLRGSLSATSSMCIIIGVFTQFLFGLLMYWRTVALVNITFTILSVLALFFVPESPHWLVSKKRHADARKSLQWLRGWTTPQAVEAELKDIQALFKTKKGWEFVANPRCN
ncbi:unnamed protein product [Parnassius apollo]|uniref:(apollo) hypothetical protein n=1 Tax=Parnassius apollo TaxID=110799 RepID=A0A8S3X893_PARAO|nr:unnamed protein product [Parnassius apollo]